MRQDDDEKEKEKITEFGTAILDIRDEMDLDTPTFVNGMVNLIAWSLPDDFDEENYRDILREFYKLFLDVKKEKKRMKHEHM